MKVFWYWFLGITIPIIIVVGCLEYKHYFLSNDLKCHEWSTVRTVTQSYTEMVWDDVHQELVPHYNSEKVIVGSEYCSK